MSKIFSGNSAIHAKSPAVSGGYVDIGGASFYRISNYDSMQPFFMTLVSPSDHWLFVSSNGGLTAGRVCPENNLFPYVTVDKIIENSRTTGPLTLVFAKSAGKSFLWEPFATDCPQVYETERNLYKNVIGNEVVFEEINKSLGLSFRSSWMLSDKFGFVRRASIRNISGRKIKVELLDGLQNILPANVDRNLQTGSSCLLDAYKKADLDEGTGMGVFFLNSIPSDKTEPLESLKATVVWSEGLSRPIHLLSMKQIGMFRNGMRIHEETESRGVRTGYFISSEFELRPSSEKSWSIVADVDYDIVKIEETRKILAGRGNVRRMLDEDLKASSDSLGKILAASDALQAGGDQITANHHLSNVLFNVMRGGIFADNYSVDTKDFADFAKRNDAGIRKAFEKFFKFLPEKMDVGELREKVAGLGSPDMERICMEYLPLTFSRRHGDPSRPWNHFAIRVKNPDGSRILDYQGNWRDIFQNWEALCISYPEFIESTIAKFLNATNAEGYNPYRVTRNGFEWEVPEPHLSWANIGYWGDHQVIYLLRLLELSEKFHPDTLHALLGRRIFSYSDIPYELKSYKEILANPRDTIVFNFDRNSAIEKTVKQRGTSGKLVNVDGKVFHASMMEKFLAVVLSKLSNFVPGGGIWLNTQRPEWNDANNALAGYGLSMVTVYYLHRFLKFMDGISARHLEEEFQVSAEMAGLFRRITEVLENNRKIAARSSIPDSDRRKMMDELGTAACEFRKALYRKGISGRTVSISGAEIAGFLKVAQEWTSQSIALNERKDGLFHSYNVLVMKPGGAAGVKYLYEMLEGQVAVLSSGFLSPARSLKLTESLRKSSMYREDQNSYLLYPDRPVQTFFQKNRIPEKVAVKSRLLKKLLADGDTQIVSRDCRNAIHFSHSIANSRILGQKLDALASDKGLAPLVAREKDLVLGIYEEVFSHSEFTGRSGTFFAYEGLGSIYWHMISKLLLAVQENFFMAAEEDPKGAVAKGLFKAYYDIREGLGFNKKPEVYGAFPTDPYSHTPKHCGASQPGMTGQVKEEIITRFGELGVKFTGGAIEISPLLLRNIEFLKKPSNFEYVKCDGTRGSVKVPAGGLAFTCCQVPFVYCRGGAPGIEIRNADGSVSRMDGLRIDPETCGKIFRREGVVESVSVGI